MRAQRAKVTVARTLWNGMLVSRERRGPIGKTVFTKCRWNSVKIIPPSRRSVRLLCHLKWCYLEEVSESCRDIAWKKQALLTLAAFWFRSMVCHATLTSFIQFLLLHSCAYSYRQICATPLSPKRLPLGNDLSLYFERRRGLASSNHS